MKDRGDARWDLLLLKIREGWSANAKLEGENHLSEFHAHEISSAEGHFETIETTVSHLFREPTEALGGLTYGRLLGRNLKKLGWWVRPPQVILEVGGGLGYVARDVAGGLGADERRTARHGGVVMTGHFI